MTMGVVERMDDLFFPDDIDLDGKSIFEIGSKVVNYDLGRKIKERFEDVSFVGIDIEDGHGVDLVADICDYYSNMKYDAVFSITVFEHVTDWRKAIYNAKSLLKVGGLMFVIVPSVWPVHLFPIDCWRFSIDNLAAIFSDYVIERIETVVQTPGKEECIFIRAKKIMNKMIPLGDIEIGVAK